MLARLERGWATWVTLGLGALAGLGAVQAGSEPTGIAGVDAVLVIAVAMLVVAAFARARRWAWLATAGLAALNVSDTVGVLCALVAVVVAFLGAASAHRRYRVVGAVVGALTVQALFRAEPLWVQGGDALYGALACIPVFASAYANARSASRRATRIGAGVLVGLLLVAGVAYAVVALPAWRHLETARTEADRGFDALADGDQEASGAAFRRAQESFGRAADGLTSPLALPIRAVPVASQHAVAAAEVAHQGEAISEAAVVAAETAPYDQLRAEQGTLDLALLASMAEPVDDVAVTLAEAESALQGVTSPWLVPPVADPLRDVIDEIAATRPDADLAAAAVRNVPGLLGADEPRRYFIAFANPAESRFLGGFVGGYGVLTAVDGTLELETSGRVAELRGTGGPVAELDWPPAMADRYARWSPDQFLQNATVTPDFPTDARLVAQVAPGYGLGKFDGVIYVDPLGLAALLELTGPVEVEGLDEPASSKNVADLLLRRQYLELGASDTRTDLLTDVADATFDALTTADLPGPRQLVEVLGPAVDRGHLLFEVFDADEQGFLQRIGTRGVFPPTFGTDLVSLRMANDGANKLDAYIERDLTYDVVVDPVAGTATGTLEVLLRNTAPEGLPDYVAGSADARAGRPGAPPSGDASLQLSLYTPSRLGRVAVDGRPAGVSGDLEGRLNVSTVDVVVPRGGQTRLTFELEAGVAPDGTYALTYVPQALARPDQVTVRVSALGPATVEPLAGLERDGAVLAAEGALEEPTRFEASVRRPTG